MFTRCVKIAESYGDAYYYFRIWRAVKTLIAGAEIGATTIGITR